MFPSIDDVARQSGSFVYKIYVSELQWGCNNLYGLKHIRMRLVYETVNNCISPYLLVTHHILCCGRYCILSYFLQHTEFSQLTEFPPTLTPRLQKNKQSQKIQPITPVCLSIEKSTIVFFLFLVLLSNFKVEFDSIFDFNSGSKYMVSTCSNLLLNTRIQ